jgi:hypothetical protein
MGAAERRQTLSGAQRKHLAIPVVVPVQSVEALGARLRDARRVVLIGNGGIALGLAHEVRRLFAAAAAAAAVPCRAPHDLPTSRLPA